MYKTVLLLYDQLTNIIAAYFTHSSDTCSQKVNKTILVFDYLAGFHHVFGLFLIRIRYSFGMYLLSHCGSK